MGYTTIMTSFKAGEMSAAESLWGEVKVLWEVANIWTSAHNGNFSHPKVDCVKQGDDVYITVKRREDRECQLFFATDDRERAVQCARWLDDGSPVRETGVFEQEVGFFDFHKRFVVLPLGAMLCNGETDPAKLRCLKFDPMAGYYEILKRWPRI